MKNKQMFFCERVRTLFWAGKKIEVNRDTFGAMEIVSLFSEGGGDAAAIFSRC
jgi:hypothetical protein